MPARIRPVLVLDYTMTAAGTSENVDHTALRPMVVIDAHVLCTVVGAASSAVLQRQALGAGAFNAVSDTMAIAVVNALTRTANLIPAQYVVAPTDVLRCAFTSANGGTGRLWATFTPTAITGA